MTRTCVIIGLLFAVHGLRIAVYGLWIMTLLLYVINLKHAGNWFLVNRYGLLPYILSNIFGARTFSPS